MSSTEELDLCTADGRMRPLLGGMVFRLRVPLLLVFAAVTVFFAWQMSMLRPDASFEKMIPVSHP